MIEAVLFDLNTIMKGEKRENVIAEALEDIREGLSLKFFEFCVKDYKWYGFCALEEVLERFFEWETFDPEEKMKEFEKIVEKIRESYAPKEKLEDVVKILRDEGITIGIEMNEEDEVILNNLGLIDLFDYVFVGRKIEKPSKKFYKRICRNMRQKPFEILLVENSLINMASAKKYGIIVAFLGLKQYEKIDDYFEEIEVKLPKEFIPDYEIKSLPEILNIIEDLNK